MAGTDVPVIRQPVEPDNELPFWAGFEPPRDSHLIDTDVDPSELDNLVGHRVEDPPVRRTVPGAPGGPGAPDVLDRIGLV